VANRKTIKETVRHWCLVLYWRGWSSQGPRCWILSAILNRSSTQKYCSSLLNYLDDAGRSEEARDSRYHDNSYKHLLFFFRFFSVCSTIGYKDTNVKEHLYKMIMLIENMSWMSYLCRLHTLKLWRFLLLGGMFGIYLVTCIKKYLKVWKQAQIAN